MTAAPSSDLNIIEPLDPEKHDRAAFSCSVEQVDNFFKRTANKLATADNLRVFVMTTPAGDLIGFYALNAQAVDYSDLPGKYARARLGHGSIPAAHIPMIGVDSRHQGKGYGGDLLVDGLRRIANAAENIGIAVVMLDVLDCGEPDNTARRKALYEGYGFTSLPSNSLRLFLPVATARTLLKGPYPRGQQATVPDHHHRPRGRMEPLIVRSQQGVPRMLVTAPQS